MKFQTKEERDQFILDNEIIIKRVIKNNPLFQWKNSEDLYQVGWEALIKCVDKYEVRENGSSFSTYACKNIRWTLMHFLDDYRTRDCMCIRSEDPREPNKILSLDYELDGEDESRAEKYEKWKIDISIDIQRGYEIKELRENFLKILFYSKKKINQRSRRILELYFLKDLSFSEIGRQLGCSRQAVKNCVENHRRRVIKELKKRKLINGWEDFFQKPLDKIDLV